MKKVAKFAAEKQLGAVIYLKSKKATKCWRLPETSAPCWVLAQGGRVVAIGESNIKKRLGLPQ